MRFGCKLSGGNYAKDDEKLEILNTYLMKAYNKLDSRDTFRL